MNQSMCESSNVLVFDPGKPSGLRVLIVEDEMLIALGLIDVVETLGGSCAAGSRVVNSLALVAGEAFDAAIVDMNLAGEPADAVMDALSVRGIPIIITTGYGADAIAEKYRSLPRLSKPYLPAQVEEALLSVLAPLKWCAQSR